MRQASELFSRSSASDADLPARPNRHARPSGSTERREGRRPFRRASRGPPDRRGVLRLRAQLAVGAEAPPSREIAGKVMPGAQRVIEYHLIARGTCWGHAVGHEPIRLREGDLIVFPQGDAHVLSSAPGMRAEPDMSVVRPPVDAAAVGLRDGWRRPRSRAHRLRLPRLRRTSVQSAAHRAAAGDPSAAASSQRDDRLARHAAEYRREGSGAARGRAARTCWRACRS